MPRRFVRRADYNGDGPSTNKNGTVLPKDNHRHSKIYTRLIFRIYVP